MYQLDASSWYIFFTYIYDARSHLYQINYSVFDIFRTSKWSSSGTLVHAVLWYFLHAEIITKDYELCIDIFVLPVGH